MASRGYCQGRRVRLRRPAWLPGVDLDGTGVSRLGSGSESGTQRSPRGWSRRRLANMSGLISRLFSRNSKAGLGGRPYDQAFPKGPPTVAYGHVSNYDLVDLVARLHGWLPCLKDSQA